MRTQAVEEGLTRLDRAMILPLDVRDDFILADAAKEAEGMLTRPVDMVFNCAGVSATTGHAAASSGGGLDVDLEVLMFLRGIPQIVLHFLFPYSVEPPGTCRPPEIARDHPIPTRHQPSIFIARGQRRPSPFHFRRRFPCSLSRVSRGGG